MINFLGGHRWFACVLFKLWQETNDEFRDALRSVTGSCAGWWTGWLGIPRMSVSRMWPTLSYIRWWGHIGWPYWDCLLTSPTSGYTVVAGRYSQYCIRSISSSLPSAPLALTCRWILVRRSYTNSLRQIHYLLFHGATHWASFQVGLGVGVSKNRPMPVTWKQNRTDAIS